MNRPNVLMAHNYYQTRGGEDSVFENEYKMLVDNGFNVIKYVRQSSDLKQNLIRKILLPITSIFSIKTFKDVDKLIKLNKIDLIHCHNTFPLISPSIYYAAFKNKIPVVQTVHNFRFVCPNALLYCNNCTCLKCIESNSLLPAITNKCYHSSFIQTAILVLILKLHRCFGTFKKINYIFLTEFSADKFKNIIDLNSKNVFIKGNFVPNPVCKRCVSSNKVFIYVGRLESEKGLLDLLKFWEKLSPDYILKILGNGSLEQVVCEYVKDKQNIFYLGQKDKIFVLNVLSSATAMVFPSKLIENFPMTIVESFSVGCPVLANDFGNGGNIVIKSGGGVVYKDCLDSFISSLNDIVCNNEIYSSRALEFYKSECNVESNLLRLSEIYNCILTNLH